MTGVVVAHPGGQHELQCVLTAQERGLLAAFATGFYFTADSPSSRLARRLHSTPPGRRALKAAAGRTHASVDARRVVSISAYHVIAKLARQVTGAQRAEEWACARWDAAVARRLSACGGGSMLVHVFEGGAMSILAAARERGVATVLDVPMAHEYARRELGVEGVFTSGAITARLRAERELADHLLAPSDFVVRCLLENGADPQKIVRLPYGADVPAETARHTRRDRVFRALFVGHVGPRKGVRYLLEAWRRLGLPNAELVLVGGADRAGRELLRASDGSCRWLGRASRDEVQRLFASSDVFLFPSLAEGSALVTYEAMAAGLPVVTTPNSGSLVRDGIDGFVVPTRDVDALAERLLLLFRDPDARRAMGARGRALIAEGFTWRDYRERLAGVYRAILAGRDPRVAVDAAFERDAGPHSREPAAPGRAHARGR